MVHPNSGCLHFAHLSLDAITECPSGVAPIPVVIATREHSQLRSMAKKRVADVFVDTLIAAGVKRVYGLVGDSLNGITDSIRPRKDLQWVPVRHEETAAFAADAEAHLTGGRGDELVDLAKVNLFR